MIVWRQITGKPDSFGDKHRRAIEELPPSASGEECRLQ
jgi:hypothetical protein